MRYRLVVLILLMLFSLLPVIEALAAPAPAPSAILDIGPPPKGMTAEEYCKDRIQSLRHPDGVLWNARYAPEVRKLPSVARLKDPHPWLVNNFRVASENGHRHLRLTFLGGMRTEQVAIVNALARLSLRGNDECIQYQEKCLRAHEKSIVELEQQIAAGHHPQLVDYYRTGINELRTIRIPEVRTEIAQMKKFTVVKWAR